MRFHQILVATSNQGKLQEISLLLDTLGIKALSVFNSNIKEPEETKNTFRENALLKAKYYGKNADMIALGDDSGFCIEALGGTPGVLSSRYAIDKNGEKNFDFAFQKILLQLRRIDLNPLKDEVKASFVCSLAIFDPSTNFEISFEGKVDGKLCFPPRGINGFGYDPIFIKDGMSQTFAEVDRFEKDKISHRGEAFKALAEWLSLDFLECQA
jgi:XTP/dITP diphosphohydrolase